MGYYDIEAFKADLDSLLTTKLNSKITEINTRKGDSVTLDTIGSEAFFFQTLDQEVINYNTFCFYMIGNTRTEDPVGPGLAQSYPVDVYIIFGNNNDPNLEVRLLRYHQVLIELLTKEWKTWTRKDAKLVSTDPAGFAQLNSTQMVRATGVTLEVTLGY